MHDIPPAVAGRLPGLHEAQEQQEARHVMAGPLGSELGVEEKGWGDGLWSVRSSAVPDHGPGNQLTGLTALEPSGPALQAVLERTISWYDEAGCSMRVRLLGAQLDDAMGRILGDAGFIVEEVEAWMAAPLDALLVDAPSHDIRVADDVTALDDFVDAFCAGWGLEQPRERAIAKAAMAAHPGPSWWRRYVARVDGQLAGEAVLAWFDDVAYLAEAATVPALRRRGVQRALIARRLADARELGCRHVFSAVQYGDPSWANMRSRGLREANVTVAFRRRAV